MAERLPRGKQGHPEIGKFVTTVTAAEKAASESARIGDGIIRPI
jgi:hypothetical protein